MFKIVTSIILVLVMIGLFVMKGGSLESTTQPDQEVQEQTTQPPTGKQFNF